MRTAAQMGSTDATLARWAMGDCAAISLSLGRSGHLRGFIPKQVMRLQRQVNALPMHAQRGAIGPAAQSRRQRAGHEAVLQAYRAMVQLMVQLIVQLAVAPSKGPQARGNRRRWAPPGAGGRRLGAGSLARSPSRWLAAKRRQCRHSRLEKREVALPTACTGEADLPPTPANWHRRGSAWLRAPSLLGFRFDHGHALGQKIAHRLAQLAI